MQINVSVPVTSEISPSIRLTGGHTETAMEQKTPVTKAKPAPAEEEQTIQEGLERLQNSLAKHDISLKFSRDETTETVVVQLINSQTGEEIRQIPSEVSIKLTAEIGKLQGWILNQQV
jgi:flagellar protein FlaG